MDEQKQVLRWSSGMIVLAIFLRLLSAGALNPLWEMPNQPGLLSALLYLQTGRVVRLPADLPTEAPTVEPPPSAPTTPTVPPETVPQEPLTFEEKELDSLPVEYGCDYRPDLPALLTGELPWEEPLTVLIVHTHATESFCKQPGEDYEEDTAYRTLDNDYNMVSIGDEVARVLEAGGVRVYHDRTHHDSPSYNNAYGDARVSIQAYLKEHPEINMVLDIHRDAFEREDGSELTTSATVGGQKACGIMILSGTNAAGGNHPHWEQNFSVALKLGALLERENPGILRSVTLYPHRLNMDQTPGSLLIEIGAAGDTHEQAVLSANALARALLQLAAGVEAKGSSD